MRLSKTREVKNRPSEYLKNINSGRAAGRLAAPSTRQPPGGSSSAPGRMRM